MLKLTRLIVLAKIMIKKAQIKILKVIKLIKIMLISIKIIIINNSKRKIHMAYKKLNKRQNY